eukprot:TRINITY_DN9549_c0_g3_i1.p1 TRINITY_DN9549_c0_g3~~TRINITY_DN9549_c0_g3_i1.p1  ORF type:complete len:309 (-),score=8.49 TRINITY_DN9549_c0_g3_i1:164-976(-)
MQNPCGAGMCKDDNKGGYNCTCPGNYTLVTRPDNTSSCLPPVVVDTAYTVAEGDTCESIAAANNLTTTQLQAQNTDLNCTADLVTDTVLTITPASAVTMCIGYYAPNPDDTCTTISARFNITNITALNPSLNCSSLNATTQVCIQQGTAVAASTSISTVCTDYYTLSDGDTCDSVQTAYSLTAAQLYKLNPGLNCNSLNSYSDSSLCVAQAKFGASVCKYTKYKVKTGDTCSAIIYTHFKSSSYWLAKLNSGFVCTSSKLYVGLSLCALS